MPVSGIAETGFASSNAYDTHRPSYPAEVLDRLLEVLEIKDQNDAKILDLGAGTGKLTELLAKRPEKYEILAVEPLEGMLKELKKKNLSNVSTQTGTADNLEGLSDHSFDAVIAAQSFHWFANMDALKEIYRVLKPARTFGMIWNIEDYNSPRDWDTHGGWEATMKDVMWQLKDDVPRFRDQQWKKVFDEQGTSNPISMLISPSSTPIFGLPIGEESFEFVRYLTKDEVWKTFRTYSQVANSSSERLAEIEKTFRAAVESPDTETDQQGKVAVHGKTVLAWATSIPDVPLGSDSGPPVAVADR